MNEIDKSTHKVVKEKAKVYGLYDINNREACLKAIGIGWKMAVFAGCLTTVVGVIGFANTSDAFFNPYLLADAALILTLAFFIYKKSRIAACILVVYFACSKFMQYTSSPVNFGSVMISMLFLLAYVNAARGTLIWHKTYKKTE
jgi:hypothetical protein